MVRVQCLYSSRPFFISFPLSSLFQYIIPLFSIHFPFSFCLLILLYLSTFSSFTHFSHFLSFFSLLHSSLLQCSFFSLIFTLSFRSSLFPFFLFSHSHNFARSLPLSSHVPSSFSISYLSSFLSRHLPPRTRPNPPSSSCQVRHPRLILLCLLSSLLCTV